ncbi:MAG: PTS sugar transporter subunit IIB [Faecalicoccus sp.]|uniref:PTS sugar transporter subunit IIB n=1 Tax=Faecalicoccus sp. TaxID=1971758 RepID=UPI002F9452B4
MKNILLVCNAGMSTSILVEKMKQVAKNKGLDVHIWALSSSEARHVDEHVDCVLIGPQLKFALQNIKEMFPDKPVDVIDMRVYGMIDGEKALQQALDLIV